MPETNPNSEVYLLIGVVAVVLALLMLVCLVVFFNDFSQELRYVKNEIRRTDGAERQYWIRKKRRLWLSLLPFIKY